MTNKGQCGSCNQPNEYTKVVCDFCGARLPWAAAVQRPQPVAPQSSYPPSVQNPYPPSVQNPYPPSFSSPPAVSDDAPNTMYAVVGFLIPIVGLILYLVENAHRPRKAASAGKGALWGFGLSLASILFLMVLGSQIQEPYTPSTPSAAFAPSESSSPSSPTVTMAQFNQIQSGMSYSQVSAIIGSPGEKMSESDMAGFHTVMYMWQNSSGSNMNAMFQNDKLINKSQAFLE